MSSNWRAMVRWPSVQGLLALFFCSCCRVAVWTSEPGHTHLLLPYSYIIVLTHCLCTPQLKHHPVHAWVQRHVCGYYCIVVDWSGSGFFTVGPLFSLCGLLDSLALPQTSLYYWWSSAVKFPGWYNTTDWMCVLFLINLYTSHSRGLDWDQEIAHRSIFRTVPLALEEIEPCPYT